NPIVLWSTWTAFGDRPALVALRFAVALGVAWSVGALLAVLGPRAPRLGVLPTPVRSHAPDQHRDDPPQIAPPLPPRGERVGVSGLGHGPLARLHQALADSAADFLDMATFLTFGAAVAAALQVLVPQTTLLGLAGGPVLSVALLIALRALVSVCAAVDAFLALAFAASFSPGALIAFMVVGPVFDLKNAFLLAGTFGRGLVLLYALVVIPLIFAAGVA